MPRLALEPADYPFFDYRRFTFSLGIVAGENVWLSGSTAVRFDAARKTMVVDGDLVEQARVIFDKMRLTLAAGGLGLRDIVRIVQYVTPGALADLPRLSAFVDRFVAGHRADREHRGREEPASQRSLDRDRSCRHAWRSFQKSSTCRR